MSGETQKCAACGGCAKHGYTMVETETGTQYEVCSHTCGDAIGDKIAMLSSIRSAAKFDPTVCAFYRFAKSCTRPDDMRKNGFGEGEEPFSRWIEALGGLVSMLADQKAGTQKRLADVLSAAPLGPIVVGEVGQ